MDSLSFIVFLCAFVGYFVCFGEAQQNITATFKCGTVGLQRGDKGVSVMVARVFLAGVICVKGVTDTGMRRG